MRLLELVPLLACTVFVQVKVADAGQTAVPVLVELFTSEGCSSCPPVDAWLQKLDASQPVPNIQLIVLSEHVDYWDLDGWKDPFSSHVLTERQRGYMRALHLDEVYTPQIVVDGGIELKGGDPSRVVQVFQQAATSPKMPLRITSASVEASNPPMLHARIEVDSDSGATGDVYVAVALNHAESAVLRGENNGQHLSHVAVVEEIRKIGRLEKGRSFEQNFEHRLLPGEKPSNVRIVAFVQAARQGSILGVALKKLAE